jgi:hypothetical protein
MQFNWKTIMKASKQQQHRALAPAAPLHLQLLQQSSVHALLEFGSQHAQQLSTTQKYVILRSTCKL